VYAFWQYDLCDVFIELMKPVMALDDASDPGAQRAKRDTRDTLAACLDAGLRLLHPFMPFVTEELWQRLPGGGEQRAESIMVAPYPEPVPAWEDAGVEAEMAYLQTVVSR
jgi:valyl-tRNA synthetase